MKKIIITVTMSMIVLTGFNACKKDSSEHNAAITTEQEDIASANAMQAALNQMGIHNDSLSHYQHGHHSWNHFDSLYHHHDSLFHYHHGVYHHGDTIHHHSHHNSAHHHVLDSLHHAHKSNHP